MKHFFGDCKDVLGGVPDDSVNLIMTSPPYEQMRKKQYGGYAADEYVRWFLERSAEFKRVLHPRGTMIVNIKENVVNGERNPYVLKLIQGLREEQHWLWTEDFIWHKTTCFPGKWPNRFRDAWEHVLQFNTGKDIAMYQDAVMVPVKDWAAQRLAHPSKSDSVRRMSRTGTGQGIQVARCAERKMVYPTNVLHLSPDARPKDYHSAVYPEKLPAWFIRLFTKEGDIVLDPFEGSGTTGVAAVKLGRSYIGAEINKDYSGLAEKRVRAAASSRPGILVEWDDE